MSLMFKNKRKTKSELRSQLLPLSYLWTLLAMHHLGTGGDFICNAVKPKPTPLPRGSAAFKHTEKKSRCRSQSQGGNQGGGICFEFAPQMSSV